MRELVVSLERAATKCIYALDGAFFALAASRLDPMALCCFLVTAIVIFSLESSE